MCGDQPPKSNDRTPSVTNTGKRSTNLCRRLGGGRVEVCRAFVLMLLLLLLLLLLPHGAFSLPFQRVGFLIQFIRLKQEELPVSLDQEPVSQPPGSRGERPFVGGQDEEVGCHGCTDGATRDGRWQQV